MFFFFAQKKILLKKPSLTWLSLGWAKCFLASQMDIDKSFGDISVGWTGFQIPLEKLKNEA